VFLRAKTAGCIERVSEKFGGALRSLFGSGRQLALPVQSAFLECIDVGDGEESCETGHAPKNHCAFGDEILEAHRPRIHEDDLDIEDDEEHGDEVELDAEARGPFSDGEHAALVRCFLGVVMGAFFAEENAESEGCARKTNGGEGL